VRVRLLLKSASALAAAAALALASPLTAQAAPKPAPSPQTGNDVSWPQCGKTLPGAQAFGVVGVNNGLANAGNPCFGAEWSWANQSTATTKQPIASVYVNTANPELAGSWWPKTDGRTQQGETPTNPYGHCDGTASAACAYLYGWSKAYDDVNTWGVPATAGLRWWLDVETGNSWSSGNQEANRADLEAMVAVFKRAGGTVGIYSTRYQFGTIVGPVPAASSLSGLDSWIPGASTAKGAQSNCSSAALTAGSGVTLAQYTSGGFDYDVSCIN
jgi:hypothetical protein